MNINEIYVVSYSESKGRPLTPAYFFISLEEAQLELDRLYALRLSENPKWIEKHSPSLSYGGFSLVAITGKWREYQILRLDRNEWVSTQLDSI
jgi:hypothetical protein